MQCPNCGLINPRTALWCDCDYEFQSASVVSHSTSLTTDGNECGECGLINLSASIWCLCGRDLRRTAVAVSGPRPTSGRGLNTPPYLIDGIAFWLPFAALLAVSPALSISALLGMFLLQVVLIFHDGRTLGQRLAGERALWVRTDMSKVHVGGALPVVARP